MKKQGIRVFAAVLGAVLSFAGIASAQYVPHLIQVNVPFDFTIGNKDFAAGDYQLRCTPTGIELRNSRGQELATFFHHSVESQNPAAAPKLVFDTSTGGHELTQVWVAGSNYGYELPASKAAAELAKARSSQRLQAGTGGTK